MRNFSIIFMVVLLALVIVVVPALATADNNVLVIKPYKTGGTYGTGQGQIDTPVSVRTDAADNIYVLQHVHTGQNKFKSVITVYDRNATPLRSFDVLKRSMMEVLGWDKAPGGFYYDSQASAFDIDRNGTIYVLCGWDIVVLAASGTYQYQFPSPPLWAGSIRPAMILSSTTRTALPSRTTAT